MSAAGGAAGGGDAPVARLAVIGAGLVGSSVARAAVAAGVTRVTVTDAAADVRQRARRLGVAHAVADDAGAAVADADLVIIATPAAQVPRVVEEIAQHMPMQAILTDVASLKSDLVPEVETILTTLGANPARFVGGHPMAGNEGQGPEAADGSLFQGATWILTPSSTTDDLALRRLSAFVARLGARVLTVGPARHDALVAVVSHLPQVAASCLADVAADAVATSGQAVLTVAGGGFRDTTRVAASDPDLWVGILEGNRAAVLEVLERYRARLDELSAALSAGDRGRLREQLDRAARSRRELVAKAGPAEVVDLVVALEDRPGALAAATTALGEAGINVEDLAMRHAADGGRGALLVRVDAEAAEAGLEVLRGRGLAAHLEADVPAPEPGSPGTGTPGHGPAPDQ